MGCFSTTIQAPEARDLGQEAEEIADVNFRYAPKQYELEKEYRPKYAELDRSIAYDNMFADNGILNMGLESVDKIAENNRLANSASRTADINDAATLGGDVLALQKSFNPELYEQLGKINAAADESSQPSQAMNALKMSLGLPMDVAPAAMNPEASRAESFPKPAAGSSLLRPELRGTPISGPMQIGAPVEPSNRNRVAAQQVRNMYAPDKVTAGEAALVDGVDIDLAATKAKQVGDVANRSSSSVLDSMQSKALEGLELGGSLDARTKNEISQSVLEQYNKMGRSMDNRAMSAIASELDKASNQRQQERFDRAAATEGVIQEQQRTNVGIDQGNQSVQAGNAQLDLNAQLANNENKLQVGAMDLQTQFANQDSQNRATDNALDAAVTNASNEIEVGSVNQAGDIASGQLALGASQVNQAADGQYRAGLSEVANMEERSEAVDFSQLQQVLGNYLATQFDPTQGVLGRPSVNQTTFNSAKVNGNFNSNPSGSLDVFNNYASQLNGQNFGEANANARADAANSSGLLSGVIGGVGGVVGGLIGNGG